MNARLDPARPGIVSTPCPFCKAFYYHPASMVGLVVACARCGKRMTLARPAVE